MSRDHTSRSIASLVLLCTLVLSGQSMAQDEEEPNLSGYWILAAEAQCDGTIDHDAYSRLPTVDDFADSERVTVKIDHHGDSVTISGGYFSGFYTLNDGRLAAIEMAAWIAELSEGTSRDYPYTQGTIVRNGEVLDGGNRIELCETHESGGDWWECCEEWQRSVIHDDLHGQLAQLTLRIAAMEERLIKLEADMARRAAEEEAAAAVAAAQAAAEHAAWCEEAEATNIEISGCP